MRVNITLECTSCKERNYLTSKTNVTILIVWKNKNIAHANAKLLCTVKQNNVFKVLNSLLVKELRLFISNHLKS